MQKETENKNCKKQMSFPRIGIGNLQRLFSSQAHRNGKCVEDPRTLRAAQPSGMTNQNNCLSQDSSLVAGAWRLDVSPISQRDAGFYHVGFTPNLHPAHTRGFTLIELLVVVLIIGVLAAIALPQYQKAVTKSRAAQLQTLLAEVVHASDLYYLHNGTYPKTFDDLDIDIGLPTKTGKALCGRDLAPQSTKQGEGFEITIYNRNTETRKFNFISAYFTTGKYTCRGFVHYQHDSDFPDILKKTFCGEHYYNRACGKGGCDDGIFCTNIMGKAYKEYVTLIDIFE